MVELDALQLSELRQGTYQLLGAFFVFPNESTIDIVSEAAEVLLGKSEAASGMAFYAPWERSLLSICEIDSSQVDSLRESYLTLFGDQNRQQTVLLNETTYLAQDMVVYGQVIADLEKQYSALGVFVSPDDSETVDHAALEMEFVSLLCAWEVEALLASDASEALKAVRRQQRFLDKHPCKWFPSLARTVSSRDETGVYTLATQAALAMVMHDVDFLDIWVDQLRAARSVS